VPEYSEREKWSRVVDEIFEAASIPGINFGWSPPQLCRGRHGRGELVGAQQVDNRDRLPAARALRARPEPATPRVAGLASLLSEVAGLAARAGVDDLGARDDRLGWGDSLGSPSCLPAHARAGALAPETPERVPTHRVGRRGIGAHGVHAAASSAPADSPSAQVSPLLGTRSKRHLHLPAPLVLSLSSRL
jgi:hypothetical protein